MSFHDTIKLHEYLNEETYPYWIAGVILLIFACFPTHVADFLTIISSCVSRFTKSVGLILVKGILNILTVFVLILSLVFFMFDFSALQNHLDAWRDRLTVVHDEDEPNTFTGRVGRRFSRAMSIVPSSVFLKM